MLELVRADIADHAHAFLIGPQNREAAVRVPGVDEALQLVAQALDGVRPVHADHVDIPIGLSTTHDELVHFQREGCGPRTYDVVDQVGSPDVLVLGVEVRELGDPAFAPGELFLYDTLHTKTERTL